MLYIISIGLHDEKDMSLRALDTAKRCGKLYCEFYTDNIGTNTDRLSRLVGKNVTELPRAGMENESEKLMKEAKAGDVGVFVGGDALSATTHIMLIEEAKKAKVQVKVVHGSSILTAVAETGLQLYKFGRTVTLTREFTKSTLDMIKDNMKAGLHTLILLDIGMTAREAAEVLATKLDCKAIAACNLGSEGSIIVHDELKNLARNASIEKTPAVICIPGKLHFMEEEYLQNAFHG
jgi:diphthine synthase